MMSTIEIIGELEGLQDITGSSCCEFIQGCRDTQRYLEAEKTAQESKNDDEEYRSLADQIKEKCTVGASLRDGTLPCSLREKYQKHILALLSQPDGHYFLLKEGQIVSSIRYEKSKLKGEIDKRIGEGWEPSKIKTEEANLPFLNRIYRKPN